ncbi:NUDIX hydrolase [Yasminevirus sp. GU-2018]|uniref:NUDIX hydrolase n=1 Tax=Yasminevirus sp. GU-2018 TaxID=2420051 RepID=A0A5K0U955_9VIRU|nr:NUDIX hydrolase [Yasminevirus sp. GU-2018]
MSSYSKRNNFSSRRKITRDTVCTNCGGDDHSYKQCLAPVTSWGVILVTYGDLKRPVHDKKIDLYNSDMTETESRVLIESRVDRVLVGHAYHKIRFLMVSRKNSVGYVEFIRGRYRPEKIDQVIFLFEQMMQSEIDKIKESLNSDKGFEFLWRDFWGSKADSPFYANDKKTSSANYELLKKEGVDGPELDLKYIVTNVKAEYDIEEWGFPKGRKNRYETEAQCALREFKEESGYTDEDIRVIHEIEPLVEEFNGTNGVRYRHVYYVAELISNKPPRKDVTESQKDEIGNIQFMDFSSALMYIRDYHVPRKMVLQKLFTYYIDKLVLSNRLAEEPDRKAVVNTESDTVDESVTNELSPKDVASSNDTSTTSDKTADEDRTDILTDSSVNTKRIIVTKRGNKTQSIKNIVSERVMN